MKDIIIITGASSGLGLELAKKLDGMGYQICGIGRNVNRLRDMKGWLKNDPIALAGDISNEDFVNRTVKMVSSQGKITAIINNACEGVFCLPTEIGEEEIDKSLTGVKGMMLLSSASLKANNEGNLLIINILSTAALKGKKMEAAYCMAKWAQRGYTESLKDAYRDTSVHIEGIYVGGMDTNLYNNSRDYISEEKQSTFMDPSVIAEKIVTHCFTEVSREDLIIERKK